MPRVLKASWNKVHLCKFMLNYELVFLVSVGLNFTVVLFSLFFSTHIRVKHCLQCFHNKTLDIAT